MVAANIFREALVARYRAQVTEALANLSVYIERPTGSTNGTSTGGSYLDIIDRQLEVLARAQEKLATVDRIMPINKEEAKEAKQGEEEDDDDEEAG